EEDVIINFLGRAKNLHFGPRWNHFRNKNYFESTILRYDPEVFRRHFRFTETNTKTITRKLLKVGAFTVKGSGREIIPPHKQVLIYLWFMATTETHRSISDRFDCTESSVGRIVWKLSRTFTWLAVGFLWGKNAELR
uniref:Uncharacterized protein n=1 Tax=Clytia hemisphaerica TaxID=252671 RepID=A0A7M6DK62_9CNID